LSSLAHDLPPHGLSISDCKCSPQLDVFHQHSIGYEANNSQTAAMTTVMMTMEVSRYPSARQSPLATSRHLVLCQQHSLAPSPAEALPLSHQHLGLPLFPLQPTAPRILTCRTMPLADALALPWPPSVVQSLAPC
jgi:hypothetical protein